MFASLSNSLDFIGNFVPPSDEKEPTPEEIAKLEKRDWRVFSSTAESDRIREE
jgi:hypothetical protein